MNTDSNIAIHFFILLIPVYLMHCLCMLDKHLWQIGTGLLGHCRLWAPRPWACIILANPTLNLRTYSRAIECFHSCGQHLCKFIGTKESVWIRKEFNSRRSGLAHQHGRRFIVLGHQYGHRDVMRKHSILYYSKRVFKKSLWPAKFISYFTWTHRLFFFGNYPSFYKLILNMI